MMNYDIKDTKEEAKGDDMSISRDELKELEGQQAREEAKSIISQAKLKHVEKSKKHEDDDDVVISAHSLEEEEKDNISPGSGLNRIKKASSALALDNQKAKSEDDLPDEELFNYNPHQEEEVVENQTNLIKDVMRK